MQILQVTIFCQICWKVYFVSCIYTKHSKIYSVYIHDKIFSSQIKLTASVMLFGLPLPPQKKYEEYVIYTSILSCLYED